MTPELSNQKFVLSLDGRSICNLKFDDDGKHHIIMDSLEEVTTFCEIVAVLLSELPQGATCIKELSHLM